MGRRVLLPSRLIAAQPPYPSTSCFPSDPRFVRNRTSCPPRHAMQHTRAFFFGSVARRYLPRSHYPFQQQQQHMTAARLRDHEYPPFKFQQHRRIHSVQRLYSSIPYVRPRSRRILCVRILVRIRILTSPSPLHPFLTPARCNLSCQYLTSCSKGPRRRVIF